VYIYIYIYIYIYVCVCVSILTGFEWVFHILNYNEMWLLSLKIIHKIWVVFNSCIFNWIKSEMCIFSFFPTIQSKTSYYGYNFVLLFHFQLTSDCHLHYIHQIVIINHNCLRTTHTQRGRGVPNIHTYKQEHARRNTRRSMYVHTYTYVQI